MSKGHRRRPSFVSADEYAYNYDRIFKGVEPETPSECTAIVKRSDVWSLSLGEVDLTKMDHPTACKYLVEGMKVRLLCKCGSRERGWNNGWHGVMNHFVGNVYIIRHINYAGVSFIGNGKALLLR